MRDHTRCLLPAWSVARRRDGAEAIGRALVLKARPGIARSPAVWSLRRERSAAGCAPARAAPTRWDCAA
jgi:hypothetical protein